MTTFPKGNPSDLGRSDSVKAGEESVERPNCRNPAPNEGLLDWLLACPDKGYFTPIESNSESSVRVLSPF